MTDKKSAPTPATTQDGTVRVLPPSYALKEKIGVNVSITEIFTPERIAAAQQQIDDTQAEFVNWANKDLVELEHMYRHIANAPENTTAARIEKIRKIAFSLKCQSGTFGYPLGSHVAESLYKHVSSQHRFTAENIIVLRKHIDALQVILQQNIQGDAGAIGDELLGGLRKLVEKFS